MKPSFVINIRASKNISGLLKVTVASPAGLMKFSLNVEPWAVWPSGYIAQLPSVSSQAGYP